ncbi:MAG: efflux RND transporter periplasmic adaptor subunit [Pseudomonadota bacterium]|nr:efflux RND transporter periplasmic adaptor subunit [Pseudomonadota bacterium]
MNPFIPNRYAYRLYFLRCLLTGLISTLGACTPTPAPDKPKTATTTLEVSAADLVHAQLDTLRPSIAITGGLYALKQSRVHPQATALVQDVLVNNGDHVHKNQTLIILNNQDQRDRVMQAQANLAAARAQHILADSVRDRNAQLFARGYVSEIELQRSVADAKAQQQQVHAQQANLNIAQKAVQDSVIRAPIAGVVTQRQIDAGQTVSVGQTLLSIIDPSTLELRAQVGANVQSRIQLGQPIEFYVQGMPEQKISTTVQRIDPSTDPSSRMLTIYADVPNPQHQLRAGTFIEGQLYYRTAEHGIVLPRHVIQHMDAPDQAYVWTIQQQQIQKTPIHIRTLDPNSDRVLLTGIEAQTPVLRLSLNDDAQGRPVSIKP